MAKKQRTPEQIAAAEAQGLAQAKQKLLRTNHQVEQAKAALRAAESQHIEAKENLNARGRKVAS